MIASVAQKSTCDGVIGIKTNDYIQSLNVPSVDTIIGNRQIYASSMGEGKTAIEKQRKGSAVDEIKKLSEQILLELNQ